LHLKPLNRILRRTRRGTVTHLEKDFAGLPRQFERLGPLWSPGTYDHPRKMRSVRFSVRLLFGCAASDKAVLMFEFIFD
jgi:hypothetical protein